MMNYKTLRLAVFAAVLLFTSCKKDDDPNPDNNSGLEVKTVQNLPANPETGGTGHYTFYSFAGNSIIPVADSATTDWDVAFNSTTILVNGGTSGPGSTVAQVVTGIFDELTTAPETGYRTDNAALSPPKAINTGSGNGWYNYNSTTHIISPIPGRVIVVRTSDNRYVKVEILSYYQGAPANPTDTSVPRYYTFRYVYQPDGTRNFN